MISVAQAKQIVSDNMPAASEETVTLANAGGRRLWQDTLAIEPSPRFTNSAMDGFAIRVQDLPSADNQGVYSLPLSGESRAGIPAASALPANAAIRISTGGQLPDGADAVIPLEKVTESEGRISFRDVPVTGQHVRHAGEEFEPGTLLLKKGTLLRAQELGLLASQGIGEVVVYRSPRIAILLTGSELVDLNDVPGRGQIYDSNGIMLGTAAVKAGGQVVLVERIADHFENTVSALEKACKIADLIIFSGGVSVGAHDLVKPAAEACKFETLFWRVRQKPGKPFFFAGRRQKLLFGLPGNPVSAFMCFTYYLRPLISWLSGNRKDLHTKRGILLEPLANALTRAQMFRVAVSDNGQDGMQVRPLRRQTSHMLTSLTEADGFVMLDVDADYAAGDAVEVILF